jgi:hypothetical protein
MIVDDKLDLPWEIAICEAIGGGHYEYYPVRSGYATFDEAVDVAYSLSKSDEFEGEVLYVRHMYRGLPFRV